MKKYLALLASCRQSVGAMTTVKLLELVAEIPDADAENVLERAALMEESNRWTAEQANQAAWDEYVKRGQKEMARGMLPSILGPHGTRHD